MNTKARNSTRQTGIQIAALWPHGGKPVDGTDMKIQIKPFRVREGERVKLKKWPTKIKPLYKSKEDYRAILETHIKELSTQQSLLYADNRYALLLIFQAMDAAGKGGAIKHVMSGVNPQGCQVFSFKHPSATDLEHDFLWRTTRCLPERGRIGIFNRSYYEVRLELYADGDDDHPVLRQEMTRLRQLVGSINGYVYGASAPATRSARDYTPRLVPNFPRVAVPLESNQILWQR